MRFAVKANLTHAQVLRKLSMRLDANNECIKTFMMDFLNNHVISTHFPILNQKQVALEFFNDRNVANVQLEFTYSL